MFFGTLVAMGCGAGAKTVNVSGKVTYQGKPLPGGKITFYPKEGGKLNPASADIQEDGTYACNDAPSGDVKVTVSNEHLNEKPSADPRTRGPMGGNPAMQMQPPKDKAPPTKTENSDLKKVGKYIQIPDKYKNADKSGLTYTIKNGDTVDIELK
ncbi:MAG: carboxypeptidase-like regulatory domain-containing protein [Gemmataceae bacterium]